MVYSCLQHSASTKKRQTFKPLVHILCWHKSLCPQTWTVHQFIPDCELYVTLHISSYMHFMDKTEFLMNQERHFLQELKLVNSIYSFAKIRMAFWKVGHSDIKSRVILKVGKHSRYICPRLNKLQSCYPWVFLFPVQYYPDSIISQLRWKSEKFPLIWRIKTSKFLSIKLSILLKSKLFEVRLIWCDFIHW